MFYVGERVRHVKTGNVYIITDVGRFSADTDEEVYTYKRAYYWELKEGEDREYVRSKSKFEDGRFVQASR